MYYIYKADRDFIVYSDTYNVEEVNFSGVVIWGTCDCDYPIGDSYRRWSKAAFEPVKLFFEETVTHTIKKELN